MPWIWRRKGWFFDNYIQVEKIGQDRKYNSLEFPSNEPWSNPGFV
jgi:hypothetical protein